MEPIKLGLHNFLSYLNEEVDLSEVACAALVGANGSGKSALLDAVTWALFGQGTKGGVRDLDNYVTRGEQEGQVDLQFALGGATYRVVRGRSLARNKSILEFFILDGDNWRPIGGKTITETQKAIEETLRMDYRTFTASALVLQGQSDSFTEAMTDQERKEALGRILGLDLWDRMQELAREKVRNLKGEMQLDKDRLATLERTVADKEGLVSTQKDTDAALTLLACQIEQAQEEAVSLEAKVQQKPILEQQVAEIERDIRKHCEAVKTKERAGRHAEEQIRQAEKSIEAARAILSKREEIEAAVELEVEISKDIAEYEKQSQEYMRLTQQISDLERKAAAWDKHVETNIASIEAEIRTSESYARTLDNVPCSGETKDTCPLLTNAKNAAARVVKMQKQLDGWKSKDNPVIEPLQDAVKARDAVGYVANAHQAAQEDLREIKKRSGLKPQLDIAAARASDMQNRIAELEDEITKLQTEIEQVKAEKQEADKRKLTLLDSLSEIKPLAKKLLEVQQQLTRLRKEEADKRTALGRIEQSLELIAKAEKELKELEEQMKQKREHLTVYEALDIACGKKAGVPALIVENVVPEIERLSNGMLGKMAGGRLAVRLDTQVEGKSTGTMQEVLRITVLDGGTERPYQTYSGAERFMVDLALRVALSKFLAHRAGAEIKLFVLDEGLGSCDATNRQAVMDAIQAVAEEFGKVIVITHIAELQDALPQRIEVTKGPDGSKVQVA
jgi:exonuclease SbcC